MQRSLRTQSHIVVTDARPKEYRDLALLAGENGWHLHFLTSGRAAIRFAQPAAADLWMINVRLPDMSGFELLEIVRDRVPGVPVFLVSDRYDSQDERRACRCGAALYLCKGAEGAIDCKPLLELLSVGKPREHVSVPIVSQADT